MTGPKTIQLSVGEIDLLLEALAFRASRLQSMANASPRQALAYERKAEAMRDLRGRLVRRQHGFGEMAGDLAGVDRD